MDTGQICEKTFGKEKGRICVVVDKKDKNFVIIDGNVKRRPCNIAHLNPLEKILKIKKGEKSDKVKDELKKAGFEITKKIKVKERLRVKREVKKEGKKTKKKK